MSLQAKWIGHKLDNGGSRLVPIFGKTFSVEKGLIKAVMHITAHGIYHTTINGKEVTDQKFTPYFTSYYYRLQMQEYDITALLGIGDNSWHTTVGDGWWRWKNNFGYRLALYGYIELFYEKGSKIIATDTDFDVWTKGIIKSDLQQGEIFDARVDITNYQKAVLVTEHIEGKIIPSESVPVREKESFVGKIIIDSVGNKVVDFGQNIAGYVKCKFYDTKKGQIIHLKHGEGLNKEGVFSTANCDAGMVPFQEITYICKGAEEEEYTPSFSVFGFRYMLLEGIDKGDFTAVALYSDMETTGKFTCSNPLINRFFTNTIWSQKSNFLDVAVDCPTRERNAWTGDAQVFVGTATYLMDVEKFFLKWLKDQTIEQYESGKLGITFPSTSSIHNEAEHRRIVPNDEYMAMAGPTGKGNIGEDSVGWGDSAVWLPYTLYKMYGNKEFLTEHYDTAKKWLEYSLACMSTPNELYKNERYYKDKQDKYIYDTKFHYGEWCEPLPPSQHVIDFYNNGGGTVGELVNYLSQFGEREVATAYTKRSCDCMAKIAKVLGKTEDQKRYEDYSEKIKSAYDEYIIGEDGEITKGHQASYVRALALDMVGDKKKPLVIAKLKEEIEKANYHLNTGFLSTGMLLPVLWDNGLSEYAFKLLQQTEAPGWLNTVIMGATTVLENWFGMEKFAASFNHYSLGAVCQFFFEYILGIRSDFENPGFKKFYLQPIVGGELTFAKGEYKSIQGVIRSEWKVENNTFYYSCSVPKTTTALLTLPNGEQHTLTEGNYEFSCSMRE